MRINLFIIMALLGLGCKSSMPRMLNAENRTVDAQIAPDNTTSKKLKPWSDSVRTAMREFVGITDTSWANSSRDGNLSHLIADAGFEYGKTFLLDTFGIMPHCAVYNFGGIRNSLPKDSLFNRDLFECLPFENEIVILQIRGTAMDSLLNLIASRGGEPVAGIFMGIRGKNWKTADISNLPFDSRRQYWVVVNDFMANAGDGYTMLKNPIIKMHTGVAWRAAVQLQIKKETTEKGKIKRRDKPCFYTIPND